MGVLQLNSSLDRLAGAAVGRLENIRIAPGLRARAACRYAGMLVPGEPVIQQQSEQGYLLTLSGRKCRSIQMTPARYNPR